LHLGSSYRSGRSKDWLKMKNPDWITPTHGYEPTRGSDDGVRQKLVAGVKIVSVAARQHRDGDESDIQ
jgi:ATP-dependent DNA ligase